MPDEKQSARILCEGGLDSTQNHINLSANKPGSATRLVNYEVGLSGGYRRLNGYELYDTDYGEVGVGGVAQGQILGIIIFDNTATGTTQIMAARRQVAAPTTYNFYLYTVGVGWVAIATGLTHNYSAGGSTVDKLRWDVGNDGATNVLCVTDGINNALIYDGTTWAFIDSADTGAAMATAGGDQAINAPVVCSFFENTLFIARDERNSQKGIVAYSAPNSFYDFKASTGGGQLTPGIEVIQIKPFRDSLYIFSSNEIKKAIADETFGFLTKNVTKNIGLVATDAVIEIGGDLIFLAPDGFRPVTGTNKIGDVQLESLSKPIHKLIQTRVTGNAGLNTNIVAIRGKSQFRAFFSGSAIAAEGAKGIIGALRTADQAAGWEFGELLGFRCSCITSRYINAEELVLHGDYDGKIYKQESGNSLNGSPMVSIYSTPYLDFGDTEVRKVSEKATIFFSGEGNVSLTLNTSFDWGSENTINPAAYTLEIDSTVSTYDDDDALYDDANTLYGGFLTPFIVKDIQGSFFSARFTLTTSSATDYPHTIHALIIEYAVKGRR